MHAPLFDASVPVFHRYLVQLQGLLTQAAQHDQPAALLQARVAQGLAFLAALQPAQFANAAERQHGLRHLAPGGSALEQGRF